MTNPVSSSGPVESCRLFDNRQGSPAGFRPSPTGGLIGIIGSLIGGLVGIIGGLIDGLIGGLIGLISGLIGLICGLIGLICPIGLIRIICQISLIGGIIIPSFIHLGTQPCVRAAEADSEAGSRMPRQGHRCRGKVVFAL